ncbi:lymphocyte antigen 6K isoform X1 [Rousettus aegyptiacus]|nr:lymphocyte antigen 6K isoform X1 [Rousettus aegyptiacus]
MAWRTRRRERKRHAHKSLVAAAGGPLSCSPQTQKETETPQSSPLQVPDLLEPSAPAEPGGRRRSDSLGAQPSQGPAPLEMMLLLALLLVMGLAQADTNVTVTGKQSRIQCHVCEEYNNFNCFNPVTCDAGDIYCVTAAVRILVRYIYVSRQCTKSCPVIPAAEVVSKPFVLVKPTPFLFAMCCQRSLCNIHSPFINDTELDYRGAGQARGGRAGLVLLLSLAAASLALRLC